MINDIRLEGRLVDDPQLRTTKVGNYFTRFILANPRTTEATDFIDCIAWDTQENPIATRIAENTKKGQKIIIRGKIQKDKNVLPDGRTFYNTYVLVSELEDY